MRIHLLLAVLVLGLSSPPAQGQAPRQNPQPDYLSFATDDEANTVEVFDRASPSVVFITRQEFRPWFSGQVLQVPSGSGSGFLWDQEGYIVTNYHVISGADRLKVVLQTGEELIAKVVGLAPAYDLAVVKVNLPLDYQAVILPLGNSDELRVGRKVLSIGNPFGFETSLSVGVVSALGRNIRSPSGRTIRNAIQTDAAINPGSSGGPLLNSLGQLIGINVQIYSPSGASAGIGLALPVNTVKRVVPLLIKHGSVRRARIGIEFRSDQWARRIGVARGVPLVRAIRGLPAADAGMVGLRKRGNRWILGDVIIAIDDQAVNTVDDMLHLMEGAEIGKDLRISTVFEGQERSFLIKPIAR